MRYILAGLMVCLFLLTSCSSNTIKASPVVDSKSIDVEVNIKSDVCSGVLCKSTETCVSGECVCSEGFKNCNKVCIPDSACCTSGDCSTGEVCENNACIKHVCGFNEVYDTSKKDCVCGSGAKWCESQQKCIPLKNCCQDTDCGSDYRCADTFVISSVCVDDQTRKCKSIVEGRSERFYIKGVSYDILVKEISDSLIVLKINDLDIDPLPIKVPYVENDADIFFESAEMVGGVCKEM